MVKSFQIFLDAITNWLTIIKYGGSQISRICFNGRKNNLILFSSIVTSPNLYLHEQLNGCHMWSRILVTFSEHLSSLRVLVGFMLPNPQFSIKIVFFCHDVVSFFFDLWIVNVTLCIFSLLLTFILNFTASKSKSTSLWRKW